MDARCEKKISDGYISSIPNEHCEDQNSIHNKEMDGRELIWDWFIEKGLVERRSVQTCVVLMMIIYQKRKIELLYISYRGEIQN